MPDLPQPATIGVAYRAQLRAVLGRIGLASILTALTVTFMLFVYAVAIHSRTAGAVAGQTMSFVVRGEMLGLVVAFLLPGQLWKGIPPRDRRALHALPIDRRTIELLRVAAGATLLFGFLVPLYLVAIFLEVQIGSGSVSFRALPWLLAIGAPLTLYLIGSILGLLTASATGNMLRILAWGGALMLGMVALGDRVPVVGRVADTVQSTLLSGPLGVMTALGSGIRSASASGAVVGAGALLVWLALALVATTVSAGRAR